MPRTKNTRALAHIECPGGGQVWLDGNILYVAHMRPPSGTTLFNVSDPLNPKLLSVVPVPMGWHSHKVRAKDGLMLVNHERFGKDSPDYSGGLAIYDVSDPARPTLITKWRTAGSGVHRFDFDGRYAYISPTAEGFVGNIMMILDLKNPEKPEEVGRWWIPGQNTGAGEIYPWENYVKPRCHHPLRRGDRLYVSYWHHGMFILDIADMSRPKLVWGFNPGPANPHPTHTCLPIATPLKGRNIMVVADEDVLKLRPAAPSFAWVYDITDERQPLAIATITMPGLDIDGSPQPDMTGCHQPAERYNGTVIPFAWFAQGMRLMDISDPFAPREVGHFEPDIPPGCTRVSSNDVTTDPNGVAYLTDRQHGVDVIEIQVS